MEDKDLPRFEDFNDKQYSIPKEPWINDLRIEADEVEWTVEVWEVWTTAKSIVIWDNTFNTVEFTIDWITYTLLTK